MSTINQTHPFAVYVWVTVESGPAPWDRSFWHEMARCITKERAKEVAECLAIRHTDGVQIAELVSDEHGTRFVGYKYIPESAQTLGEIRGETSKQWRVENFPR